MCRRYQKGYALMYDEYFGIKMQDTVLENPKLSLDLTTNRKYISNEKKEQLMSTGMRKLEGVTAGSVEVAEKRKRTIRKQNSIPD